MLLSPTYGLDDCPQSLQQLPQGHLFCLHPQDHPPEGQRKTSRPAHRHFYRRKRQLACFPRSTSESRGWRWRRRERGDGGDGRSSEAEEEEEEGRSAQNVTPPPPLLLLLSCMIHGGWRGEFWEGSCVQLQGCLWEMDAFKCGAMLPRLKGWCWWKCSHGDSLMALRHMENTGCQQRGWMEGGWWSSRQPHSHIHASASAHMMVQTCVDLAERERGGGDMKVSDAVLKQQEIVQHGPLVGKRGTAATTWRSLIHKKKVSYWPLVLFFCYRMRRNPSGQSGAAISGTTMGWQLKKQKKLKPPREPKWRQELSAESASFCLVLLPLATVF